MDKYKQGFFFSNEFLGDNSWNGYEHNCLFANVGEGMFMDVARPTGSDCVKDSRGVAIADFNSDGRLDLVINNNNETPVFYLNNLKQSGNAVVMQLVGTRSNRDAIGAQVRLRAGGKTMTRQVEAGSGYASEGMFPVHFGLGAADRIDFVEIKWPSGTVQRIEGASLSAALGVNRRVRITEGSELAAADSGRELARRVVIAKAPEGNGSSGSSH